MCNRYRPPSPRKAGDYFKRTFYSNLAVTPNTAPTELAPILRNSKDGDVMVMARFGFLPQWAVGKKLMMTNTRIETIREKQAFKNAYQRSRCVIPADMFYEFREEDGGRQPYGFERKDGGPIFIAGICAYIEPDGQPLHSFSMVTIPANDFIRPYHDRTLLMIEDYEQWLDLKNDPLDTIPRLDMDKLQVRPMLRTMNSVREKDISKIDPKYSA